MLQNKKTTINLILTALFTSIIVVSTMISIPMPNGVAITLQTFSVALCGYMLGVKYGAAAVAVYIALGAAGLPVFTGFGAGVGKILGVTGGFMWGFFPFVILCGLVSANKNRLIKIAVGIGGLLFCHLLGIIQFAAVTGNPFWTAALTASIPYLIKDIISVAAAMAVAAVLQLALKKSGLLHIV